MRTTDSFPGYTMLMGRSTHQLLTELVDRWIIELSEAQRVALDPDLPLVPQDVLDGLDEKILLAVRVRDELKRSA